jgi:protein TonB
MFQSVIEQRGWFRSGRLGTGAGLSILAHAAVLGAVLFLSGRTVEETPETIVDVGTMKFVAPPKGNPHPVVATQLTPRPRKPRTDRVPRQVPPPVQRPEQVPDDAPETRPDANPDVDPSLPYIEGSDPNGVETGGVPFAALNPALANIQSTGEDVLPFGEGMTRPEFVSGPAIVLPRDVLPAGMEGTLIIKCVVTREGEVDACKVIKGLGLASDIVRSALEARRYTPVTFQGRAVSVSFTFNLHVKQPR